MKKLMNTNDFNEIKIEESKIEEIKRKIIYEEKKNVRTKGNNKDGMVELLKNIIVEEVNKKY